MPLNNFQCEKKSVFSQTLSNAFFRRGRIKGISKTSHSTHNQLITLYSVLVAGHTDVSSERQYGKLFAQDIVVPAHRVCACAALVDDTVDGISFVRSGSLGGCCEHQRAISCALAKLNLYLLKWVAMKYAKRYRITSITCAFESYRLDGSRPTMHVP